MAIWQFLYLPFELCVVELRIFNKVDSQDRVKAVNYLLFTLAFSHFDLVLICPCLQGLCRIVA